jgi:magnesium-transporting ATPase (P-type)
VFASGAVVGGFGLLWGRPALEQLAIAASLAVAAVPEGLPLLAGVGEAAVAHRLAQRRALVRRLSAVEALGRVDVACADKTGTRTEGRLRLSVVADNVRSAELPGRLDGEQRHVLEVAALASPHPEAAGAEAHPTDVAVVEGAEAAGLGDGLGAARRAESPFDPARPYYAAAVGRGVCVKGAAEALSVRCSTVRKDGEDGPLTAAGRRDLMDRAERLAAEGFRVLMVAEGPSGTDVDDPRKLTALGFVAISDPVRPGAEVAVARCRRAGVRLIMLTGDHPATARAVATEVGILEGAGHDEVISGAELVELDDDRLDRRLENVSVIARITPLDKLRVVQSLQRRGHTVAMTGDGVNDAPALRLADVGIAMGRGGTDVARQAADVVLADDDFLSLVETFVEGRSFWRNLRRALGLLLGGNLGEVGLMVGATALGLASPLRARQILAVNLVSDVLPAVAVAVQPPIRRDLSSLAREGVAGLDAPLRRDIVRRGAATAVPSLAAYGLALRALPQGEAQTVAFASIVGTQLAQALDIGRADGPPGRAILASVGASAAILAAAVGLAPARTFLGLAAVTPLGLALIASSAVAAAYMARALGTDGGAEGSGSLWARSPAAMPRLAPPWRGGARRPR